MRELHWDEVEDGSIDPGEYDLEIASVKDSQSSNGNDCLDVIMKQVDGPGRHFERFPLVPQSLWKLKRFVKAAGLDTSGSMDVDDLKSDLVGCVVHAIIEKETYQGEERSRAKAFSTVK